MFQEEYGDSARYRSPEYLYEIEEFMRAAEGTHTILDIDRAIAADDPPMHSGIAGYGTLRPLALNHVMHHFGTDRPSLGEYEQLISAAKEGESCQEHEQSLLGECQMRWTSYYVVLHTDDRPTHPGVFGFSRD